MNQIASIVTAGYGSWGSLPFIVTRGYGPFAETQAGNSQPDIELTCSINRTVSLTESELT